jgi:serine/threonine protein phosphatase PrpC
VAIRLETAAGTHTGRVRHNNQDSYGSFHELGLYVVCDGMGGAAGGEVASKLAMETFLDIARQELTCANCDQSERTPQALRRATAAANRAVVSRAGWDTHLRGMGTTLVGARVVPAESNAALTLVNVGDSRAYLCRDGQLSQLTDDHSYVAERVRQGLLSAGEAATSSMQSVITRAIGAEADVVPDIFAAVLQPGDTLLLTSDGLTRHVSLDELQPLVAAPFLLESVCESLIAIANHRGGADNITCILVRLHAE